MRERAEGSTLLVRLGFDYFRVLDAPPLVGVALTGRVSPAPQPQHTADNQPCDDGPERGAHARDRDAGSDDCERDDGRQEVGRVLQRGLEGGGERPHECEPGDGDDDALGRQLDERGEHRRTDPDDDRDETCGDARDPAAIAVGTGLGTCRQRRTDGGEVDAVRSCGCAEHRAHASEDHRAAPRHVVAEALHDRDARHVLRGHRDDVERQRQADDRLQCEDRGDDLQVRDRGGDCDLGVGGDDMNPDDDGGDEERGGHRPPREEPDPQEPHDNDGDDPRGVRDRTGDRPQAELQEHSREHRLRDRGGDAGDEGAQRWHESRDDDEQARHEEGAHGRGPTALDGAGRHEERSTRRRPGDRDGQAGPAGEDHRADAHEDRDGHEAAGRLRLRGARSREAREDDDERAGERDERGDDASGQRLGEGA